MQAQRVDGGGGGDDADHLPLHVAVSVHPPLSGGHVRLPLRSLPLRHRPRYQVR